MILLGLVGSARRLAFVGLAKNTGKTVALGALLDELGAAGLRVGVTSVGRDGEQRDVIDVRVDKPRVRLAEGSLVASTDSLLRASGLPFELLEQTRVRTPLGRVLVVRLCGAGSVEVAGPSAVADVRGVCDAMLCHGAERVLIDGAMDRRAACSPDIVDGVVLSTGAVLGREISEVVSRTTDAVDLVRLARLEDRGEGARVRAIAAAHGERGVSVLVGEDTQPVVLAPRFALTAGAGELARLLDARPDARYLLLAGALPEAFARELAHALHHRCRRLSVVVTDSTRVFTTRRGVGWYGRHGLEIQVLNAIALNAVTVNPLAPASHRFDSAQLQALIREAIPDVPIVDVLQPHQR